MRWRSLLLAFTLFSPTAAFAQTAKHPLSRDGLSHLRAHPMTGAR